MKKNKAYYWIVTGLMATLFGISGIKDLLRQEPVLSSMHRLGYPDYMMNILGIAKLTGIGILIIPHQWQRLKEWAYAGFAFDALGAFLSHISIGEGLGDGGSGYGTSLIAIVLIIVSYRLYLGFMERNVH